MSDQLEDPSGKTTLTAMQLKRMNLEEKRRQRILVVREKQAGIVKYRKVTMAELRLRRQVLLVTFSHLLTIFPTSTLI